MNTRFYNIIVFGFLILISVNACRERNETRNVKKLSGEQLVEINRELVIKERERIESYISRKELKMEMSESGFWYSIIKDGAVKRLTENETVNLDYTCSLLDGTLCYSSDDDGILKLTIGKSDIPSGLDAALRLFSDGTEALVILPNSLAYGLLGDGQRIPSRSALIYHIKVSQH